MPNTRVIPCLLLSKSGLVKTVGFADPKYVGDPLNAVRIFNEKEVDELFLLDIEASRVGREPHFEQIKDVVSEAFMPVAYGGGVSCLEHARRLVSLGVEKISVNTETLHGWDVVKAIADRLGASSTVVAVDVHRDWLGRYRVYSAATGKPTALDPVEHIQAAVEAGAGEILVNDVVRDGTGRGYDLALIRRISGTVKVPIVVCGGAGRLEHLREAVSAGASAVAAGSMFVYVGRHRAVMINYPSYEILQQILPAGRQDHGASTPQFPTDRRS